MKIRKLMVVLIITSVIAVASPCFGQDGIEPWYQPFAFLMGKTWKADLTNLGSAEGVWEWMFEGHVIRARGWVRNVAGEISSRNETVITWDPESKRPAFWFFLADGSYSTGYMELNGEEGGKTFWDVFGRHLLSGGGAFEWRGRWEIDPFAGVVTIRELVPDGAGGWTMGQTLSFHVVK